MTSYAYDLREPLLRAEHVGAERDGVVILRDVDLEIRNIVRRDVAGQGQVVGILGPSGLGKTTLLRILAGLDRPTHGRVLITEQQHPVRPGMAGVVFQSYPLFEHRRVLDNLLVAARSAGLSRAAANTRAHALLERFGLTSHAAAWPAQLSGGQRQRVAILQQLLCGHTYLMMDEPFSGLDPGNKARACDLITEVARMDERTTIVLVTHDIPEAIKVSDTLWLMGREHSAAGTTLPGARIIDTYDLIARELAWRPGIERTPPFTALVHELEDRFATL
ncbi:MAG: ABC transporter ATP-binding protein [Myxococcales bacterium]|nr:ABC transporter ATP-binding protein [Myxococcales bacterium]